MIRRLRYILLLALACVSAQAAISFRHIGSSLGLPHSQVQAIVQDSTGYIWIGTRNGLARYDGYEMNTYYHPTGNEHSLLHNFVHRLYVDSKNRLWVCAETGLCMYRQTTDDFKNYSQKGVHFWMVIEDRQGHVYMGGDQLCRYDEATDQLVVLSRPEGGSIHSMAFDHQNNLYAITDQLLFKYDAKRGTFSNLTDRVSADFINGSSIIAPLLCDSKGRIWMGRNGMGLQWYDPVSGAIHVYPPSKLSSGIVRAITEDKQGRMWVGTEKGITIIRPADDTTQMLAHSLNDAGSLSDNAIYTILCDRQDNMWVGSYFGGVDLLLSNNSRFSYYKPSIGPGMFNARVVRGMIETAPGIIWIATEDNGIYIYDSKNATFTPFTAIKGLGTNVHTLYYDQRKGEVWIGTRYDGLYRYQPSTGRAVHYLDNHGLPGNAVFYVTSDAVGRIWVGTMQGLRWYNPDSDTFMTTGDEWLDHVFVYTLHVDSQGDLWVGTTSAGIFHIDGKSRTVSHLNRDSNKGLKDDYIISLLKDSSGRLWIGTNNEGLQYQDAGGDVKTFEAHPLLSQCTICSITEDKQNGRLWISTSQGLFVYDVRQGNTVRYSTANGLAVQQFNYSSALITAARQLWLGTINGLVSLNLNDGALHVHKRMPVVLGHLVMGETKQQISGTRQLKLSYDEAHDFSISYGVIQPEGAENIEYQVYVKGLDHTWRNVGHERRFQAYNLQPGRYQLRVRANSGGMSWEACPVTTLDIVVSPPFYRSVWAWLIYLFIVAVLCWLAWRFFSMRLKEKQDVRLAKMEKQKIEELDRAKSDFFTIVSHELKTPLSLIIAPLRNIAQQHLPAVVQQDLDMAIKNTDKMSELVNQLVTFNKLESNQFPFYVSLGNPLELVVQCATMFKQPAAEKHIAFSVDCEDNGEEVWFSPNYVELILNNLISNALKFTPNGGSIKVTASITLDASGKSGLMLSVKDSGIGVAKDDQKRIFDPYYQTQRGYSTNSSGWGIGLALVKRLAEKHQGYVGVESEVEKGSEFTVWLCTESSAFSSDCHINGDKPITPTGQSLFSDTTAAAWGLAGRAVVKQPESASPLTLLVVDDNDDMRQLLSQHLGTQYHVLTAEDGVQALKMAQEQQIDLIISDVMMPHMNGVELCERLKNDMATSHIPVILLTAKTDPADVIKGYESGAEAYVSKPFDLNVISLQIKNILSLIRYRQAEMASGRDFSAEAVDDGDAEIILSEIDRKFITRMNDLVEQNLTNSDFSIEDITRELGVSRSLLHIKMKNLMNISMGDYLRKRRIEYACQMLQKGYNISETAYKSGFSGPNYFSKAFKKIMGVSPTDYVKNITSQPSL